MEVVENRDKYLSKETRAMKFQRWARQYIWVVPVLVLAGGLAVAYLMIQRLKASSPPLQKVEYDVFVAKDHQDKPKNVGEPVTKLETYQEQLKEKKKQESLGSAGSRYEKIISGRDLIKGVRFGDVIYEAPPAGHAPAQTQMQQAPDSTTQQAADAVAPHKTLPWPSSRTARERSMRKQFAQAVKKPRQEEKNAPVADTLLAQQHAPHEPEGVDYFNTVKSTASPNPSYIKAYVYGHQEVLSGAYVRLRLGEEIVVEGKKVPKNTVFTGLAKITKNKITIEVRRIDRHDVHYQVYDKDYSRGIVISAARAKEIEEALNESLYDNSQSSAGDIPYEIIRDVTQTIVQKKKRKQAVIELHDGYGVYIHEEDKS